MLSVVFINPRELLIVNLLEVANNNDDKEWHHCIHDDLTFSSVLLAYIIGLNLSILIPTFNRQ